MMAKPVTCHEENMYQPNIVENQWVSIDITQSQANIELDKPKMTMKATPIRTNLVNISVPPTKSSSNDFL